MELYQALVLPFGLQLGGFLMVPLGLSSGLSSRSQRLSGRLEKRAAAKPKATKLGTVITFRGPGAIPAFQSCRRWQEAGVPAIMLPNIVAKSKTIK